MIDVDAVLQVGPLIPIARSTPRGHEIAVSIELEHGRGGAPDRARLIRLERARSMHDPYVVACVHRHAGYCADEPSIRERFWPQRIDFVHRRLRRGLRGRVHRARRAESTGGDDPRSGSQD
jgi:hypothetical protein